MINLIRNNKNNNKKNKTNNVSTTTLTSGLVAKSLCFFGFLKVLVWSWLIWINPE